ncbi:TIGR00266 family protein [Tsukamurella sp. 8F]|uniref:TIGR00266 family protein n=1 Tax=unclassified Tsukamurella TaxID=2633480 RepID=UPI0023B908BA|nr:MULTISPECIES: TIGR00266 family protein [unclassified Tsukamurella]MDF0531537.1 TIGR00266 family protein [Tsukamurella sp. 8J]MDF0588851.1 TIGR00266 family protein [Tsukamurella sp. 8F]
MQVQLRHNPSFSLARCFLQPNEPMTVESGAMVAHSAGIQIQSQAQGGIMQGLRRSILSGESFFVSTFTAPPQGGWVDVAGTLPGDIASLQITPDRPFYITRGGWLASSHGAQVSTQFGGARSFFGGEGAFGLQAAGQGEVLVSCYGAIDVLDLQPGEGVVIDTGHVVAYDLNMRFELRRAVQGKWLQSMKSGEGLVFEFTGPGRILLQTRNPRALEGWIRSVAPSS